MGPSQFTSLIKNFMIIFRAHWWNLYNISNMLICFPCSTVFEFLWNEEKVAFNQIRQAEKVQYQTLSSFQLAKKYFRSSNVLYFFSMKKADDPGLDSWLIANAKVKTKLARWVSVTPNNSGWILRLIVFLPGTEDQAVTWVDNCRSIDDCLECFLSADCNKVRQQADPRAQLSKNDLTKAVSAEVVAMKAADYRGKIISSV